MDVDFAFTYWLILKEHELRPDTVSPFQGLTLAAIERAHTLSEVAKWPAHPRELFVTQELAFQMRRDGVIGYRVFPVGVDALCSTKPETLGLGPMIIIGDGDTDDALHEWLRESPISALHVTTSANSQHLHVSGVSREILFDLWLRYCESVDLHVPTLQGELVPWPPFDVDMPLRGHFCTLPMESALVSLGAKFLQQEPLLPTPEDGVHVTAMVKLGGLVRFLRNELPPITTMGYGATSLIISAITLSRDWYRTQTRRDSTSRWPKPERDALDIICGQTGYYFLAPPEALRTEDARDAFMNMTTARTLEVATITAGLAIKAASSVSPVLRLPAEVNKCREPLAQLGVHRRYSSPKKTKRAKRLRSNAKLFRRLVEAIDAAVPTDFREFTTNGQSGIKVVADLPIELATGNHLPLMLEHPVSRIPVTPGNLCLQRLVHTHFSTLSVSELLNVRVVRTLSSRDRIRRHLEDAIATFKLDQYVEFCDVTSASEFRHAVATHTGGTLVVDGHGSHLGEAGLFDLLGEDSFSPWDEAGRPRCPQLIILSACDTSPADRNSSSTANWFLTLGARCVIGSLFPIESGPSAAFIARLLRNLAKFVPLVLRQDGTEYVRLNVALSMVMRMQFVSELLLPRFRNRQAAYVDISQECTREIAGGSGWFERCARVISERSDIDITQLAKQHVPEVCFYSVLGDPESIHITPQTAPRSSPARRAPDPSA